MSLDEAQAAGAGPPPPHPAKYLERAMHPAAREYYRRLAAGRPATTRCPACERTAFPPRVRCERCGGATEWVELPPTGTLEAFTTQETALRVAAPAVLALARLGEVVVPGIADGGYDELRIGQAVEVETFLEPALELTLLRFRTSSGEA